MTPPGIALQTTSRSRSRHTRHGQIGGGRGLVDVVGLLVVAQAGDENTIPLLVLLDAGHDRTDPSVTAVRLYYRAALAFSLATIRIKMRIGSRDAGYASPPYGFGGFGDLEIRNVAIFWTPFLSAPEGHRINQRSAGASQSIEGLRSKTRPNFSYPKGWSLRPAKARQRRADLGVAGYQPCYTYQHGCASVLSPRMLCRHHRRTEVDLVS